MTIDECRMSNVEVRVSVFSIKPARSAAKWYVASVLNPNVAKISYRRVGCAHQISLISSIKGGHSPPYTNLQRRLVKVAIKFQYTSTKFQINLKFETSMTETCHNV